MLYVGIAIGIVVVAAIWIYRIGGKWMAETLYEPPEERNGGQS